MTIQFNCPTCNALIAFRDKHSGKRARCLGCGQRFIIPSKNHETPRKVETLSGGKKVPVVGFCRSAFIGGWQMFIKLENAAGLVFVVAAVCFKFFVGHRDYSWTMGGFRFQAPLGLVVTLAAWGCLFWYYMEIICSTAFDVEELPDVYMGGLFGFLWNIIRSLCIFAIALVVVQLPCIIFLVVSRKVGIEPRLVEVISHILAIAGMFAFPMAILTFSVGRDITMVFRLDYILKPIVNAFWPYFAVVVFFVLVWELQLRTTGYDDLLGRSKIVVGLHLLANIAVQALAIVSMRSIGLFHRHYSCYFSW